MMKGWRDEGNDMRGKSEKMRREKKNNTNEKQLIS